jgi:hypothetical protein
MDSFQKRAEEILRSRARPNCYYSINEIQWAVDVMRRWDANHPLLRYHERSISSSKPF